MSIPKIKKDYFIGSKNFYKRVLWVVLPIIIQNTITNVVNLLDNVMVGRIGTVEMSAVAIVNQLLFVVNLCIFGGLSGAGIFATQYAGAKDDEGLRYCFRIKIIIGVIILVAAGVILGFFPKALIGLYLSEDAGAADAASTLSFGLSYICIMLIGLIPFTVSQIYSSSLREMGETKLPMYASSAAIVVNLMFNYFLIFGKCGFPRLGVVGAALATTLSRFVEMGIVMVFSHKRKSEFTFLKSVYSSFYIPVSLCRDILKKGSPLLFNELLWSTGMAFYLQCYSVRGLQTVAAANIASTVNNIFNVVLISIGSAISIMVGQCLGANEIEKAKKTVWRLISLSVVCCIIIGVVLALLSEIIPQMYNTEQEVKLLAKSFLLAIALILPFDAFAHGSYFTLRSGGKTMITFFFDSGFMWLISAPLAYILANFTSMQVGLVYFCIRALDIVKTVIGVVLIRKGVWISNIVEK